jgi:hypothetical protein
VLVLILPVCVSAFSFTAGDGENLGGGRVARRQKARPQLLKARSNATVTAALHHPEASNREFSANEREAAPHADRCKILIVSQRLREAKSIYRIFN